MGAALRWPPPPAPPYSRPGARPGLSRCTPERAAESQQTARWFGDWCRDHAISVRDLSATLGVSIDVAHRKIIGASPVTLQDIRGLPARYRRELILAFEAWCVVCDAKSEPHR